MNLINKNRSNNSYIIKIYVGIKMKILKYYRDESKFSIMVETFEDLWTLERIIFKGDLVKTKSLRRYKPNETDVGELKDVIIEVNVEKTELDKNASRLRVLGKIVYGKPMDYISLNSHHTLNIAPGDKLEITKTEWDQYIIDLLERSVKESRRPKLGIVLVDDEKAISAKILGYGIEFGNEIYNNLSKNLSSKEYDEYQTKFFNKIIDLINNMGVNKVVLGGPGFTKDNIKAYIDNSVDKKVNNVEIILKNVSNTEKSGVYELIKNDEIKKLMEDELIRSEFSLMEEFLKGLTSGSSKYKIENVNEAIDNYEADTILVNDDLIDELDIKNLLNKAEQYRINIKIFNSLDEAGQQLKAFGGIASIFVLNKNNT